MRVFLIAGEASGDRLGAALMEGLATLVPEVTFEGIGGPEMTARGLESLFPMEEVSVMGVVEILARYRALKRRIAETAEAVVAARPDVLITIDLPEFSLRVAERVKARADIRTVHYVAPTVWAWRPKRADRMAAHVDQVLALLPFEPPYMEAAGMRCDFVGHPVVAAPQAGAEEAAALRASHGVGAGPLVLALPGSRKAEVARLTPVFRDALAQLAEARPDLRVVVPAAHDVADQVAAAVADWPGAPVMIDPRAPGAAAEKRAAFAEADVALAASGTVSLELAAAGTPMVIAYDGGWISHQIIGRMVRVDTVTLVNLVSGTRTVPEFLGRDCRPGPIAAALGEVLDAPGPQHRAMAETMARLGAGGDPPGLRAARAVLEGMGRA